MGVIAQKAAIDRKDLIELNGTRQRIHLIADRPGLPGLLVLHGGPGVPNRHAFTGRLRELARDFFLILWDQRGVGGSYRPRTQGALTLDRLVADAAALTTLVRERHSLDSVSVLGFSWGTELGIRLIQRHPELYAAYVGSGQAVDGIRNEEIGYATALAAAREAGDAKGVAALERVGPPVAGQYRPVVRGLITQRQVAARHHPLRAGVKQGWVQSLAGGILTNSEYSGRDRWGYARGATRSLAELWPAVIDYDFTRDAAELAVPVTFLQGRYDLTTPSVLVEEYAAVLRAPSVRLVWFEESGHGPSSTETAKFIRELRTALLPDDKLPATERKTA
ncbi:alpha/beta fold hydrolase [Gryllotalpicola protaetiae]|uniref:alpha/beta fold hydrolase n=1 Tax=Gryllotalpicola protaetiae TaxID=2419771 RepID=UPI0013C51BD3|nr:alpha/beta hydrolase [Gryllotalpicola protaetiae]